VTLDPWPFVIAAYAIVIVAVALLSFASWRTMRRAETALEASRQA
jgi:hypothetical protein